MHYKTFSTGTLEMHTCFVRTLFKHSRLHEASERSQTKFRRSVRPSRASKIVTPSPCTSNSRYPVFFRAIPWPFLNYFYAVAFFDGRLKAENDKVGYEFLLSRPSGVLPCRSRLARSARRVNRRHLIRIQLPLPFRQVDAVVATSLGLLSKIPASIVLHFLSAPAEQGDPELTRG